MRVELTSVESSNLDAIGYDEDTAILVVRFKKGAIYTYEGVPQSVFWDLEKADSVGREFNKSIKSSYDYERASNVVDLGDAVVLEIE